MCIMAMAWAAHRRWRLILIGNRDEYHARAAAPLDRWDHRAGLIAGRDLQSGGTWVGVSEAGRAAIVTNLRGYGGPQPHLASRGALVTDLLAGDGPYADVAQAALDDFNPFNLILVEPDRAYFLTNRPQPLRTRLTPGLYGLSNGALDAPWPKTLALKAALLAWLTDSADAPDRLFDALRRESLPDVGIAPAIPSDAPDEAAASPIFIRNPLYGTRCSTVIAIDRDGQGQIMERRFDRDGGDAGDTRLHFQW
ncbi:MULTISPECIES: NRDE family protein [Sphingobium]|uniref:NRDE family protein n=1 Tax=Sphingobium cupriresistens TaxID=1132417 RepID=A0A8G1ZH91_9SPHN|nr:MULTISPECIES: NRDE family protein [Sphingobium]MBJ7378711.1 NRDE family protein [Sphingobium sp.]RYM12269.1 NRDE family protein [Sphingobium cupriresistens]